MKNSTETIVLVAVIEGDSREIATNEESTMGGGIRSRGPSKAYDMGWDRVFSKEKNGGLAKPN
jgi:hypothetical protein